MLKSLFTIALIVAPVALVEAALPPFIPADCLNDGDKCQLYHLVGLANNIIKFLIAFGILFGVVMISIAGFQLVLSGGNESAKEQAKSRIMNIVWGFIIILVAYLMVSTLLKVLTGKSLDDWSQKLEQTDQKPLRSSGMNTTGQNTAQNTSNQSAVAVGDGCPNCTTLSGTGIPIKSANACKDQAQASCRLNEDTITKLQKLNTTLADYRTKNMSSVNSWIVNEAWPPTTEHVATCHRIGTCVDVGITSNNTAVAIDDFVKFAYESDLRAVYEVPTSDLRDAFIAQGTNPDNIIVVAGINGSHFSVYDDQ